MPLIDYVIVLLPRDLYSCDLFLSHMPLSCIISLRLFLIINSISGTFELASATGVMFDKKKAYLFFSRFIKS